MNEATEVSEPPKERLCNWRHVHLFDNFLRPLVHSTKKLFGPHVKAGATALDIGCGRGFASLGLARLVGAGGKVIAADLQPEMLDMVRERAERAGLADRILLHSCAPDRLGVEEKVDFALAFWMVHEVPDRRAFLEELHSVLVPGGRFFVAEPKFHVSRRELEHMIEEAGEVGMRVFSRPKVRLSRGVVLERP
jgi:ubiquinone/menaquinone biosynthesis C-methylase UbiE